MLYEHNAIGKTLIGSFKAISTIKLAREIVDFFINR